MSQSRHEWKVGVFVFIGLVLLAGLAIEFSKGLPVFQRTYEIHLLSRNVGGLKERADVLMSGVKVGLVSNIRLEPGGKEVKIVLRIYDKYEICKDARFIFDTSGFLGDQFVAIIPQENKADVFNKTTPDKPVNADPSFNLQEFTRSASGFISRIDVTVSNLNEALGDVTRIVLNPQSLTNLSITVTNLRRFSDDALVAVNSLNGLVRTNAPALHLSSSNLVVFSDRMEQFAGGLNGLLETNSSQIHAAVVNLESSSESLKSLMEGLEAGRGLAGNLLKNEELAASVSQVASNLSVTSSNLNQLGLWGILWKHKAPRTNEPTARPLTSPRAKHD